jgi:ubiquinone biosynthesis protein UbiJ
MSTVNRKVALGRDQARVRRTVLSLLASSAAVTITGAPAFADELADLRANQELLQARIEQLEHFHNESP